MMGTSGTAPLQYSIDGITYQQSNIFNNLKAGNQTGWVKDANGWKSSVSTSVITNNNLNIIMGNPLTICEGETKTISPSSIGTDFTWGLSTGIRNTKILSAAAVSVVTTKYYLSAKLGICNKKDSIIITVNPAPKAVAER